MKSHIDTSSLDCQQSEDNLTFIGAAYIMRFGNGNRLSAKVIPISHFPFGTQTRFRIRIRRLLGAALRHGRNGGWEGEVEKHKAGRDETGRRAQLFLSADKQEQCAHEKSRKIQADKKQYNQQGHHFWQCTCKSVVLMEL